MLQKIFSPQSREKLRQAMRERWKDPLFRKRITKIAKYNWHSGKTKTSFKNRSHSTETKKVMSDRAIERLMNPEFRERLISLNIGRKQSSLTRRRRSLSLKKKYQTDKQFHKRQTNHLREMIARPEVRKKISEALKGKPHTQEHNRKVSDTLKKKWQTKEYREKMVEANNTESIRTRRSKLCSGPNNPAWLGGISKLPYGWQFNKKMKEKILKRDNQRCCLCKKQTDLVVHHIDYDKMNNRDGNLITLCRGCNARVNKDRSKWIAYFTKNIN